MMFFLRVVIQKRLGPGDQHHSSTFSQSWCREFELGNLVKIIDPHYGSFSQYISFLVIVYISTIVLAYV